jgi:hypothetical protein
MPVFNLPQTGQQTAVNNFLQFRLPVNTVLYIRNVSTGKAGRWFVISENGEQQWM